MLPAQPSLILDLLRPPSHKAEQIVALKRGDDDCNVPPEAVDCFGRTFPRKLRRDNVDAPQQFVHVEPTLTRWMTNIKKNLAAITREANTNIASMQYDSRVAEVLRVLQYISNTKTLLQKRLYGCLNAFSIDRHYLIPGSNESPNSFRT